jgi:DNA-binding Lrp family transcriptional regulator
MILHRRIHKLRKDRFDEGVKIALEFNELAARKLDKRGVVYQPAMAGAALSRNHIVIDTLHASLAEMEQYFRSFGQLPEVKPLLARWNEVEEESWAENYVIIEPK